MVSRKNGNRGLKHSGSITLIILDSAMRGFHAGVPEIGKEVESESI